MYEHERRATVARPERRRSGRVSGRARTAVIAAMAIAAGAGSAAGQASACPSGVPVPRLGEAPAAPPDSATRGSHYWGWSHAFERANRGVGVLRAMELPGAEPGDAPPGADWLPRVELPLYWRPGDAAPAAWMARGWWVPASGEERPLAYRGMMEIDYEEAGLVVTDRRPDGWLQIHVDIGPIARAASDGLMWTHECLRALGSVGLSLTMWEDLFVGPDALPLSFLGEASHALRSAAGVDAPLVAWLEPDDEVEILAIDGDWARVRAFKPGVFLTGCRGREWVGAELGGWVKWRDPAAGTWLWYPTRGC